VIGIGINVNQRSFPGDLQPIATSLRIASGSEWSRVELCAALLKSLDSEYRRVLGEPGAKESVLRRFAQHSSSVQGRQVAIEDTAGLEGVTEGLDAHGFLKIRTPQGLRMVLSGTVRLK